MAYKLHDNQSAVRKNVCPVPKVKKVQKMDTKYKDQSGNCMVELAIVLPLVIIFTFGAIEFGWIWTRYRGLQEALYQAAYYGASFPMAHVSMTQQNNAISQVIKNRFEALLKTQDKGVAPEWNLTLDYNLTSNTFEINLGARIEPLSNISFFKNGCPVNLSAKAVNLIRAGSPPAITSTVGEGGMALF